MFHNNQFIFFDESGEMNFSPRSSIYVVLGALNISHSPTTLMENYWKLRHDLYIHPPDDAEIRKRYQNRRFHASEDPQVVRNRVFDLICENLGLFRVNAIILEKNDVYEYLRKEEWLYEKLYYYLIRSILYQSSNLDEVRGIQLLIDHTEDKRLRRATVGGIRSAEREAGLYSRSGIYHATSHAHPFLQIADYFCWAIYRKYESEDNRSYDLIRTAIENEWLIFNKNDPPG